MTVFLYLGRLWDLLEPSPKKDSVRGPILTSGSCRTDVGPPLDFVSWVDSVLDWGLVPFNTLFKHNKIRCFKYH